jgi:hypothetical protein
MNIRGFLPLNFRSYELISEGCSCRCHAQKIRAYLCTGPAANIFMLLLETADMSVRVEEKDVKEDSFGRGGGGGEEEEVVKEVEVGEKQPR